MSLSPPIRRLSSSSNPSKREEDLINAYEAEEERIINVLSRKLEQLQEEKIQLENVLEAESESQVNRLAKELTALRLAQARAQQTNGNGNGAAAPNGDTATHDTIHAATARLVSDSMNPSSDMLLESMRRENEQLRNKLVDTERECIRISRLNEIYREELIELRNRLGLPVDYLIGLSPAHDPFSQPTHRRAPSHLSSPIAPHRSLPVPVPAHAPLPIPHSHPPGPQPVPIPRPPSQVHRPVPPPSSSSGSPSAASSPALSPLPVSTGTSATTPPSSSGNAPPPATMPRAVPPLSYPSVPPPSLSSSFGSPVAFTLTHLPPPGSSPVEAHTSRWRRGSGAGGGAGAGAGAGSRSPRGSIERGFRVAETGSLVPRSRRSSVVAGGAEGPM